MVMQTFPCSLKLFFLVQLSENGLHCDCPKNSATTLHTSYNCNHKYTVCPDTHICFHGAPCIPVTDSVDQDMPDQYMCDCTKTTRGTSHWVGDHCEVRVTKVCEDTDNLDSDGWLCANDASCVANENDVNEKCVCNDEFTGPHCEYKANKIIPDCDLKCFNNGQCKLGAKDFGKVDVDVITSPNQKNGMHCVCEDGFTGVQCETYVNDCGDTYCLNSARCMFEDDKTFCDCPSIVADIPIAFSGKHCEHSSSSICTSLQETDPLDLFCVNDGTCRQPEDTHKGCLCSDEYTGFRCEFKKSEDPEPCNLQCSNGGVCRNGIADFGDHESYDFELTQLKKKHIDFKHCSCPTGYTGVLCGIELNVCGDDAFVCAFGSKCISGGTGKDGKEKFACDCDPAHTVMTSYAGNMCEYESTSFCAKGDGTPGESAHAFCTNGGKCLSIVAPEYSHQGCLCPSGFTGDYCEFKTESVINTPTSDSGSKSAFPVFVSLILFFLISAVVIAYVISTREEEQKTDQHNDGINAAENENDNKNTYPVETFNTDGEMRDIEIT